MLAIWIDRFITENAPLFLRHIYFTKVTRAFEREVYFRKYGGENWLEKYHSCADYKYYIECINGDVFKEELRKLIACAIEDLTNIIKNDTINGVYTVEQYSDIYYTFEQFECALRASGY